MMPAISPATTVCMTASKTMLRLMTLCAVSLWSVVVGEGIRKEEGIRQAAGHCRRESVEGIDRPATLVKQRGNEFGRREHRHFIASDVEVAAVDVLRSRRAEPGHERADRIRRRGFVPAGEA